MTTTTEDKVTAITGTVTLDGAEARKALASLKVQVPARRTALPVLECVAIETSSGRVTLTATDLDVTCELTISGSGEGSVLVNRKALTEALKGAKGPLTISSDGETVTVTTAAGMSTTMYAGAWFDWPCGPGGSGRVDETGRLDNLDVHTVSADDIKVVALAASGDGNCRPMLAHVRFDGSDMAATDSYRLHLVSVPGANYPKVNIPARVLLAASKVAESVTLRVGQHGITSFLAANGYRWAVRNYEGDFPNYSQLIPQSQPITATFNRPALTAALKALPKCDALVPIRFSFEDGTWTVTIKDFSDGPTASVKVPGAIDGEPFAWGASPSYFADCISVGTDAETVTVHLTDHLKPMTFRDGPLRLLMPVRLS
jgi:DNA polymerase-3 subunit beta